MRSQRSPSNENASLIARSTSRDSRSRSKPRRAEQPRAHGGLGHGQRSGHIFDAHLFDRAQDEDGLRNASGRRSMLASIRRAARRA